MIEGTRFALFMSSALVLALTPGPGMLYVMGRTLHGGRREGVLSSLGTFVGGSVHVVAAALGLSVILATSAIAFEVVRYAGAAYLIYLGIAMIRDRNLELELRLESGKARERVLQGITTEALNPKTALFFLSFIPQFVSPAGGHVTQYCSGPPGRDVCRGACAKTQTKPQIQPDTTNRVRGGNDRPRRLCRRFQMTARHSRNLMSEVEYRPSTFPGSTSLETRIGG